MRRGDFMTMQAMLEVDWSQKYNPLLLSLSLRAQVSAGLIIQALKQADADLVFSMTLKDRPMLIILDGFDEYGSNPDTEF